MYITGFGCPSKTTQGRLQLVQQVAVVSQQAAAAQGTTAIFTARLRLFRRPSQRPIPLLWTQQDASRPGSAPIEKLSDRRPNQTNIREVMSLVKAGIQQTTREGSPGKASRQESRPPRQRTMKSAARFQEPRASKSSQSFESSHRGTDEVTRPLLLLLLLCCWLLGWCCCCC